MIRDNTELIQVEVLGLATIFFFYYYYFFGERKIAKNLAKHL